MAVATRQKSTARRFVSILAVLEGTYSMLCTGETAVTIRPTETGPTETGPTDTGPIVAWFSGKFKACRPHRRPRPLPSAGRPCAADLRHGWLCRPGRRAPGP